MSKKKYNEIEVKDNMKVKEEEVVSEDKPKEKQKFEKIITSETKTVKKGLMSRLITGIIGPEGLPGIGSYVNDEIVKPAIKNIIVDAVTSGINMVMYGERGNGHHRGSMRHSGYNNRQTYAPRTNYGGIHRERSAPDSHRNDSVVARPVRQDVTEVIIEDRYDAAQVLATLTESADMYDSVSVADYYDMIGVASKYTDNNYGWTMDVIVDASIMPVRGGYIIKFPPVVLL